jgi:hypothetical protein
VRLIAIEIIKAMYKIVGQEVRMILQELEGIKPSLL